MGSFVCLSLRRTCPTLADWRSRLKQRNSCLWRLAWVTPCPSLPSSVDVRFRVPQLSCLQNDRRDLNPWVIRWRMLSKFLRSYLWYLDIQFYHVIHHMTDLKPKEIYDVFDMLDTDGSGIIDFDEFYLLFCILVAHKVGEVRRGKVWFAVQQ